MIGWLKGKVVHRGQGYVILEIGGVGYKIFVPNYQLSINNYQLFIHHHVREDVNDLYGFDTQEELEFFELLLAVPGVGPKVAMTIMGTGNLGKLRESIVKSDTAILTAIAGVGPKLAAKIVVELKSKLVRGGRVNLAEFAKESQDLVDALQALGYNRGEISKILAKMPSDLNTTQAKVTWALKHLTR